MQNRKRTGFISVLLIILCLSVCIGATYAYFTDSVESKNNIIKAGKLDVTMEWANGTADPKSDATAWTDASTGAIFNYNLWEPGYTDVRHIRIKNVGNLAFQYKLVIVANGEISTTTVDGETISLADVIDVYYFDPAIQVEDREVLANKTRLNNLTNALAGMGQTATGNLKAGESVTITIALKMQENADNKYQELSIGTDFSIQLHATQYTHESDAFDENYDVGAKFPCNHNVTEEQITEATYEAEGSKRTVCKDCGLTIAEETIPMLDYLVFTLHTGTNGDYYTVRGSYTLYDSPPADGNIVIPSTYCGLPVTEIETYAFEGPPIKSITIPDSVTFIGSAAFYDCWQLESVTLPANITSIETGTFWGAGISTITIPSSVVSIGDQAFECSDLREIVIPSGVKSIGDNAFSSTNLSSITIPNSVISIGKYAFSYCEGLTDVTISSSVLSINTNPFESCYRLLSITVDEENTAYQSIDGNLYSKDGTLFVAYAIGKTDTSFTIPDSVTTIGMYAFSTFARSNLTSITIPDSVTTIGGWAFYGCSSLTSITFEGTTEQWNAIEFGGMWKYNVPATEVICSDEVVKLK